MVEGGDRARLTELSLEDDYLKAGAERIKEPIAAEVSESTAIVRSVLGQFELYVKNSQKVPEEVLASLSSIDDPARLMDTIAAQMTLALED